MPKITIPNEKREIEVPAGSNLRLELQKAGVEVYQGLTKYLNCFGHGTCGTCKVLIKKGMENLSPKTRMERFTLWRMLSSIGREEEMRLSCQVQVNSDCTVETHPGPGGRRNGEHPPIGPSEQEPSFREERSPNFGRPDPSRGPMPITRPTAAGPPPNPV